MYQIALPLNLTETPLDASIVGPNDRRWGDCVQEWLSTDLFGFDIETYTENKVKTKVRRTTKKQKTTMALNPWVGFIRIITIGLPSGRCLLVDLGGWVPDNDSEFRFSGEKDQSNFIEILRERLENRRVRKVGANLKFDFLWVKVHFGIDARCPRDIMLMSQMYWAGVKQYRHSLKAIAERLGFDEVDKSEQSSDWGGYLSNSQLNYAAKDSLIVLEIYEILKQKLESANLMTQARIEMDALPVFVGMEYGGFPVDEPRLDTILKQYKEAYRLTIKEFTDKYCGVQKRPITINLQYELMDGNHISDGGVKTFSLQLVEVVPALNPDSPKQLLKFFNDRFEADLKKTDKKALLKTDQEALMWLSDLVGDEDKEAITALLHARTLATYVNYLEGCKRAYFNGSVRGAYRQQAPKGLGRSTCGDKNADNFPNVNLQNPPSGNLPRELDRFKLPALREIFKVYQSDFMINFVFKSDDLETWLILYFMLSVFDQALIVSDLSSAHARIATEASRDKTLITEYNESEDPDFHSYTAAKLAQQDGLDWDRDYISKTRNIKGHPDQKRCANLRKTAKPAFYLKLNGGSWRKIQMVAKVEAGIELTEDTARLLSKAWDDTFSGLRSYQNEIAAKANVYDVTFPNVNGSHGVVIGLSGRRVFMTKFPPKFENQTAWTVNYTEACMIVWMTTEADIIKLAAGKILSDFDRHPEWCAYIANIAHDEIDAVCDRQYSLEVATCVQKRMREAMGKWIKSIPVDDMSTKPEKLICKSWAEK